MNPYSKPTSPSSPSTNIPARFISSIAKRPLAESGYYRSASKDRASGPSDFTAKEDLEYFKSGYDSARPWLGSSVGSQGGAATSSQAKLSTSDLAQNYATNHTNNHATDSNYLSKSIGYSPINGSNNAFLSPQRFITTKADYGSKNYSHNDVQNYYSADANLEQTASDNFNIYSKQKDEKQQSRKFSEERLQAILENVRNRKFEDKPRYGNPYVGVGSDQKISTPELSNYTKEHRDSFRSEDRPLQIRSQNLSQNSGIQVSSNLTTERGNKEILSYLTNTNTVPTRPGPYIDVSLLHGSQAPGSYLNNQASGIANYSPLSYTPVNAFGNANTTEATQKPTSTSNYSLYDNLKKNPLPIEPKTPKEDDKGFSFRDNKEKEISFQKDSGFLGSSLLQSNYSLKQETPSEKISNPITVGYSKKEYESTSQPQPESKPKTSEHTQPLPHQPMPLDNLKTTAVQTLSDSIRIKEHNSPYEISNLTSPPVRRHNIDTASFESNLPFSSADSSMSKKTFYTIEHNNPLAIRAFKDTVAGLAVSATPEKNTNSHFESPSLFEDLQRALSKQNVQINRIIIETVENYPSKGSPNVSRHQPEEYSRPDIIAVTSKALFEPPKNSNRVLFQEVRKEPEEPKQSTPDLVPQKLDYSNPTSSINYIQQSEGGLISNEPSVRESEPKEIEKRAHESNVSSFAQQKSISSTPAVFNDDKDIIENHRKNSSSQETHEQKPSIKDVDFKNETESQKSAILIEEPLNINYSAQPSERNDERNHQLTEESEKKIDESQQSIKQPTSDIPIKSPELSVKKNLSEQAQEIQPAFSISNQPELESNHDLQQNNQPEEEEPVDENNFEDAVNVSEEQKAREDEEKSDQFQVPQNIQQEEQEPDFVRHRVIEQPKEEIQREVPEEIKKTAPSPALSKNTDTGTKPQSSNIAVKAVIGILVLLLLVILGSELMATEEQ